MMNLIHNVLNEYNENILTDNFKNSNYVTWNATNLSGIATMGEDDSRKYDEGKSLRLYTTGYSTDDTTFSPSSTSDFSFIAKKSGTHLFSFRTYLPPAALWFPEVEGHLQLNQTIGSVPHKTFNFQIGNNTQPEFTFEYRKWQTFYEAVELAEGVEYYFSGGTILQNPTFTPDVLEIFFDGFKMEFIGDRDFIIPTYYTKPSANDNTSSGYKEITASTTIYPYDKMINVTAGTFGLVLPTAKGIKGKEFEFINSGSGITTFTADGVETIEGITSYVMGALTGVKFKSNGANWKIIDKFRMETLNRTQWVTNIALTAIPNATSLNLLTLIPNASKFANGTDGGPNTLDITGTNKILTNWRGNIMSHHIRLVGTIATGSDQHYTVTLRRFSDNSVLSAAQLNRNADTGLITADFLTYTYSEVDPFCYRWFLFII